MDAQSTDRTANAPMTFSPIVAEQMQGGGDFLVRSIDLAAVGPHASPVAVLDNFRVRGRPFPPHPHAGFSAVTYVFEDSEGDLRSRDSLGNDLVTGPGGVVWTQAGRGVIHEEMPARSDRELHGLQIFVNLRSHNKLIPPSVFRLTKDQVPEWDTSTGNRVRVVAGSFESVSSPLQPAEPFTMLDAQLLHEIGFTLERGRNALIYVLDGAVLVRAGDRAEVVTAKHALGLGGGSGLVTVHTDPHAHIILLSGEQIQEPVLVHGSFIMNDVYQVEQAVLRYEAGEMGRLTPLR